MKRQPYYGKGVQAIDLIESADLNFNLGNVVKYATRAGKKDPKTRMEDLGKALWYLRREMGMGR
mgnify:CR=1 FL=1